MNPSSSFVPVLVPSRCAPRFRFHFRPPAGRRVRRLGTTTCLLVGLMQGGLPAATQAAAADPVGSSAGKDGSPADPTAADTDATSGTVTADPGSTVADESSAATQVASFAVTQLKDSPAVVTVISGEDIRTAGARDLIDILHLC